MLVFELLDRHTIYKNGEGLKTFRGGNMENGLFFDDELCCENVDIVSMYLLGKIRKTRPEWFEETPLPPIKKKRRKKLDHKSKFTLISTRNNDSLWEDNLPDFVAFEKSTRVYQ